MKKRSDFWGQKFGPNRPMQYQMVEQGFWGSLRRERFGAEGSRNEIENSENNSFGREVITHASRPKGLANLFGVGA